MKKLAPWIAAANAALTAFAALRFGWVNDDLMNGNWAVVKSWPSLLTDVAQIWKVSPV